MSLPRFYFVLLLAILIIPGSLSAGEGTYNYISATDLEARLSSNQPTNIVDIQEEKDFSKHHIKGAIPTHAYPVKSDADHAKLDATIDQLETNPDPVVIVCPRGAGGAKRTYNYLLKQEVSAERLLILEKGQSGWTSAHYTETE